MPSVTLTDITLRTLQPASHRQVIYVDRTLRGFGVRVTQTGSKSYVLTYGPDRRRIKLGDVGVISLKEARAKARDRLAEHQLGIEDTEDVPTFNEAKAVFLASREVKNKTRTVKDYKRLLSRHFNYGSRRLTDITPQSINRRIDKLHKTVSEQNHALVAIKVFFNWARKRQYIKHSPCEGLETLKVRVRKDRLLTDADIAAIYKTAVKHDCYFSRIVRICILTGLRRSEAAWLCASHFSIDTLTVPATITKNKREFVLPIGPTTQAFFKSISGNSEYLFPADRGDKVFGGWSKQKGILDQHIAKNGYIVEPWVLHSLRKYFATTHAAIGTPIHVTERLLNHISGSTTGGLIDIYQKHTWLPEMRTAMLAWERKIASLVSS